MNLHLWHVAHCILKIYMAKLTLILALCLRELPRAKPEGTLGKGEALYLTVYTKLSHNSIVLYFDLLQSLSKKVMVNSS